MLKSSIIFYVLLLSVIRFNDSSPDPTKLGGTVSIGDHICMRQTEITLQEWLDFIANNDFDPALYPDSNALSDPWTKLLLEDLKSTKDFRHLKAARSTIDHQDQLRIGMKRDAVLDSLKKIEVIPLTAPVTGITYEQAIRFCKWREKLVNSNRDERKKVVIGLPSIENYKHVIENMDSLCSHCSNPCRLFQYNYKHAPCGDKDISNATQGRGLLRVDAYWPTSLGLFGTQGNAAEMTSSKGIAMGGSFRHYARQSFNTESQSYSGPQDWLGFRYIVMLRSASSDRSEAR